MFIKENGAPPITVHYKKVGWHYIAYSDKDFKNQTLTDEERESFSKVVIQMKQLTWGLYNELQEGASEPDDEGNQKFIYRKYKEQRLVKLMLSWDATTLNDKGEAVPVPITEESIKSLAPEIAETILNVYEDMMYLTEEEEKK